jgi:hypothetical protein
MCDSLGLEHESKGEGVLRHITVRKQSSKAGRQADPHEINTHDVNQDRHASNHLGCELSTSTKATPDTEEEMLVTQCVQQFLGREHKNEVCFRDGWHVACASFSDVQLRCVRHSHARVF